MRVEPVAPGLEQTPNRLYVACGEIASATRTKLTKAMFGASSMLYGGTSYGEKVDGAPAMVRKFDVVGETARSWVLAGGGKVPKRSMVYSACNFDIPMFWSVGDAIKSLGK